MTILGSEDEGNKLDGSSLSLEKIKRMVIVLD